MLESPRLPVIYISGPFRAPDDYRKKLNRDAAEALAFLVWQVGAVALCPHMNTANFDQALPDAVWLAGDIELLRRCDAMVLTPNWALSEGATAERLWARAKGVDAFESYYDPFSQRVRLPTMFQMWFTHWKEQHAHG